MLRDVNHDHTPVVHDDRATTGDHDDGAANEDRAAVDARDGTTSVDDHAVDGHDAVHGCTSGHDNDACTTGDDRAAAHPAQPVRLGAAGG